MKKTLIALGMLTLTTLFLSLGQSQPVNNWVPAYVTNHVKNAIAPCPMSALTSVRYYSVMYTNEVPITELKPGDTVMAILDISAKAFYDTFTNKSETLTNAVYSANIVGYTRFVLPVPTNQAPTISGIKAL